MRRLHQCFDRMLGLVGWVLLPGLLAVCLVLGLGWVPVQAAPFAYITNGFNTVSVIDTASNTVTATILVGRNPFGVAVNPAGTHVYVGNQCGNDPFCAQGTVSVIDTASNTVTATIPVGNNPRGVAVNPAGTHVYVGNLCGNDPFCAQGTVSVIDTASNTVTATIPVGGNPSGVAVNPAGTRVYVANFGSNTVSVIDTASNTVTATIPVDSNPIGVSVNPTGTRVYVANQCGNDPFCTQQGTVSVINTASNTVTATILVGLAPQGVAVNPTGTRVYVANVSSNTVSVIDTASNTVAATIPIDNFPIAFAPVAFGQFIGPATPAINAPPVCVAAQASPSQLWPPNHKLAPVRIVDVTDPDNDTITLAVTSVRQDEPVNGLGDGDASPDAFIQGSRVLLRAERAGPLNGRVYHINFTADDGHGGQCRGLVTVCVPHDQSGRPCIDDGPLYDSTQP